MEDCGLLIPGLPNEISLSCLVRVSVTCHNAMIKVSKPWRNLLLNRDSEFYKERTQLGLLQPAIFLIPKTPSIRDRDSISLFFKKGAMLCPHKSQILVMGGEEVDEDDEETGKRSTDFFIVDTLTREIKRGPNMVYPTSAFAGSSFAILNNRLYVAGGVREGDTQEEDSAEWLASVQCYDISSNTWRPVCPMPFPILPHFVLVQQGMFVVSGFSTDKSNDMYYYMCYFDETDSWTTYDMKHYLEKVRLLREHLRAEQQQQQHGDDNGTRDLEELVKAKVKEISEALNDNGPLIAHSFFSGTFTLHIKRGGDKVFKWKNMGDFGRVLQSQDMSEFHSDQFSLLPREALPSITIGGKALQFSAQFKIRRHTSVMTPPHTNWYDLPLLFHPVCGGFKLCGFEFMRFDFVVVYY